MAGAEKDGNKSKSYYINSFIGIGIMVVFWFLPAADPITPLGMKIAGIFLGVIYLWSTIGALWPSILGLFAVGMTGYLDTGFSGVWLNAIGNQNVLLVLFVMILFGGFDEAGNTKYMAKWILTRKAIDGHPFVFMIMFFACAWLLSGLSSPVVSLFLMWPIGLRLMEVMGITREDRVWKFFFMGAFISVALGQPLLPFKGAVLVPLSSLQTMTENMGTPMSIPMVSHILFCTIMSALILLMYLLAIKLLRVDLSKMRAVEPAMIEETLPLPPMQFQHKAYFIALIVYLVAMLLPGFMSDNPVVDFLDLIGTLGTTVGVTLFMLFFRHDGKPLLAWKQVANKQLNWGVFFMVACGVYLAGCLSNKKTGITSWLVQVLSPVLGNQSELAFVAILLTVALIITSFAHNGAMAVVMLPVALSFSQQLGIDPLPVCMCVIMIVFVAMLTPAASVPASMVWGNKDIYSTKDILSIGFPVCIGALLFYIFIGYPIAKVLLASFGA